MPVQARATATRQRIIDAAVELFVDRGYAETGLAEMTERAGITSGAFYYHFRSKEALAGAIIAEGWPKAWEVFTARTNSPTPGLENVITMTFAFSDLTRRDRTVWLAAHLSQAVGQLSDSGRHDLRHQVEAFVRGVADSAPKSDLRAGVTPQTVGNLAWTIVHGCCLLSEVMSDDVVDRLAESWRMLLPAMVPEKSLTYFQQFLARTATQFQASAVDKQATGGTPG